MENKRFQFGGRRENNAIPNFPFKDSNGVTVKECRRKTPGRRMIKIQGKWIDELGMSVDGGATADGITFLGLRPSAEPLPGKEE